MHTFRVAGLVLKISAQHPMGANEKWEKFAVAPTDAQLHYEVRHTAEPLETDGELLYTGRRLRVLRCEQGKRFVYSNFFTGKVTASVLELPWENGFCRQITIPQERYPWGTAAEHLFELYDLPHYLPKFGKMLLHCAYVLFEGKAIVFTAPSGIGKSTQAELWRQSFGAQVVNGDRAAIGACGERAIAYGVPFSGSSDACENVDAPIAAIVSLSQAKENEIQKLSGRQALKELMRGAYVLPEHQEDLPEQIAVAQEVLQRVPMYHLACLPNRAAAQLLLSAIRNEETIL